MSPITAKLLRLLFRASFGLLIFYASPALSEYWLANRYAQNCAGCHAPGRINRPPSERRCTLSCQGCHVNPNGGGLTNSYGLWNQQRWLRSFSVDSLRTSSPKPALFRDQLYALAHPTKKEGGADTASPSGETKHAVRPLIMAPIPPGGHPLVYSASDLVDEQAYDRTDGQEKVMSASLNEFEDGIPSEDPYRDERSAYLFAGGQFRYLGLLYAGTPPSGMNRLTVWPMAVDVGLRFKPIPQHLNLVIEGRYLNQPKNGEWDTVFTNESRVRSAYVLVDALPYNSYVMYGLYRPMFGLQNPDHDTLGNVVSGLRQRSIYKAFGFGSAPNVPFVNFNLITPIKLSSYDQSSGFVLNAGGRWVTLGASLVFSLWKTKTPDTTGNQLDRTMIAVTAGTKVNKFVINGEILYVRKEFSPNTFDSGTLFTGQAKYQIWRESYLEANIALGNSATNLKQGASSELSFGWRGFLIAGTDVEVLLVHRNNSTPTSSANTDFVMSQLHLFL